ncbi:DNA phosphorothioation system sulfurtransferase DndC [Methylomonas sp. MgM2]
MPQAAESIIETQPPHVDLTKDLLLRNYLADSRPWVVAYSGGKDSTLVLQLVYELIYSLDKNQRKPVFVIASDTRVEAPNVESYLDWRIKEIQEHARANDLPIHAELAQPTTEQSFWFNLIGKGYPPPTRWFRWCTTKMKIKPVQTAIEDVIAEYGSVILLLGSRSTESSQRSQSMGKRELSSRKLNAHVEIPNALVLSPIADWTSDDVWEYLFTHNPPPWGGSHDFMLNLYRQANGGECPVVMDLNTPSCGGSRFGCWTCTVIKTDKSMESFIENGEEWMKPLNNYRNWLKEIREDESRRSPVRRNGAEGQGPFIASTRKEMLQRLLEAERQVQQPLISDEEIVAIQRQWTDDFDIMDSAFMIAEQFGREPWKILHKTY